MAKVKSHYLEENTRVSSYKVLENLGRGWEGEVYKVAEVPTEAVRAMKLFRTGKLSTIRHLAHVAWYFEQVRGTGHFPIYHHCGQWFFEDDSGCWFLVFEFIDGIPLATSTPIRTKAALAQSPNPPPYDVFLQQLHRTTKHEEYLQAYLAIRPALAAEYVAYLAAPDWRERRNQAMERAGGRCEICARPAVDVHHRTYRNVGAEPPQDLLAVCRSCHSVIHGHTGP